MIEVTVMVDADKADFPYCKERIENALRGYARASAYLSKLDNKYYEEIEKQAIERGELNV
jgi:hypothetical protein